MTDFSDLRSRPNRTLDILDESDETPGADVLDGSTRYWRRADNHAATGDAGVHARAALGEHPEQRGHTSSYGGRHRNDSRFVDGPWA